MIDVADAPNAAPDTTDTDPADAPAPVKLIDVPEDVRASTVEKLVTLFKRYEEDGARRKKVEQWTASYRAYMGYKYAEQQWMIREIFRQVETLIPKLAKTLLSGDVLFTLDARQEGFDEAAEGAAAVIHDQIHRYGSMQELQKFVRDFVMYGTVYLLPGWRHYKRTHKKLDPMHAPEEKDTWDRKTTEVPEEAPFLEYVGPWDVFSHPQVEEAKNSPAVFIIRNVTVSDLKTMVREGYLDADATQEAVENNRSGAAEDETLGRAPFNDPHRNDTLDDDVHELMMCWTFDGMHYRVLDREVLVGATMTDDGKIPLITARNYPQSREHWGVPEPITIIDDQKLLNDLTDLFVKQNWYQLPMWTVKEAAFNNFQRSTFKPGGYVRCTDPAGDIGLLPQSQSPATVQLSGSMEYVLNRMKLTSGLSNEVAGSKGDTGTATGIVRLQDAADDRIQHKCGAMLMPALKEAYAAVYNLDAMRLNVTYKLRVAGPDGVRQDKEYPPSIFAQDIDVTIEVGSDAGLQQANHLLNIYKVVGQDPLVNREEILKELWKASDMKHVRRFAASSMSAQGDALQENMGLTQTGIIADPKAGDNHQVHYQIHSMDQSVVQTPQMQNHIAIHATYLQQLQAQNAQAQQATLGGMGNQAQGVGQQANQTTEAMFQNGQRGASQQGAAFGKASA